MSSPDNMVAEQIEKKLRKLGTKERAKSNAWFFKTGSGQYGEGDLFLGVTVPDTRKVIREFVSSATRQDAEGLLLSPYHEVRLAGAILYVALYTKADTREKTKLFRSYLKNAKRFNNWDLVDVSSASIVGDYLSNHMAHEERLVTINKLIKSKNLWENRIIMIACHYQIRKGNEKMAFYVAEKFLTHKHDLMHKAIGWMLREVGKYSGLATLNAFLDEHAQAMPRTALRYALERHSEEQRAIYMLRKGMLK